MLQRKSSEPDPAPIDPKAVATTLELFEQVLPPIQLRVRRAHLQSLAERIVKMADPAEGWGLSAMAAESWHAGLIDPQKPLAMASLVVLLIRLTGHMHLELAEVEREVAGHVEAYARAAGEEGKRKRLEAMIDATARSRKRAREDRRALDRFLDLDALRERFDQRRDLILVAIELAIMAVGPAVAKAMEAAGRSRRAQADVADLLGQAEPIRYILEQLSLLRRWPTRLAALESLERILDSLGMPTPILRDDESGHRRESLPMHAEVCDSLGAIGRDRNDHEWVQAKAIVCLRRVDAGLARELMTNRLGLEGEVPDPWPKRDFLVRRLVIAELCRRAKETPDLELLLR
ncbi:MAG: hypothetical protein KC457_33530, partial [Myxococcales bacterium]|nr:hypothetical protein [Myxococcales bacterium]